ncbi:hypothetical protein M408DRAFT_334290 [Serendipita vermifera MAFF 305830]|uniref:Uncharacterized protein n=1 Tax=Serendipita vermifera MAFF 305830 TaxID=933852 RepID=A0A0C3AKB2_SERVB|nr:hypothetical protein M408DRAFT_334290 [Serendipita vermifera MAFF 305830]
MRNACHPNASRRAIRITRRGGYFTFGSVSYVSNVANSSCRPTNPFPCLVNLKPTLPHVSGFSR